MSARLLLPLAALAGAAVCLTASACGGSGTLAPPTSDSQYDDPDQPSTGSQAGGPGPPVDAGAAPVALPSGEPGIGFDDLRFAGDLSELLVPGGRSGNLDIVDPSSERVTAIGGFSTSPTYTGDASFGAASADEGNSLVYVVDRTTGRLSVVDPTSATIVASTALLSTPGYVRYVAPTQELWVTEPGASQIEIFTLTASGAAAPAHAALLPVPGGPESLAIDVVGKRAYTNAGSTTVAIDVVARSIAGQWPNGCDASKGIAVDGAHGWVMAACAEGKVSVVGAQAGAMLGSVTVLGAIDQISYDPVRQRLYAPSATALAMAVISPAAGTPALLGSIATPGGGSCAVSAGGGAVFVCAPAQGALLFVTDPF